MLLYCNDRMTLPGITLNRRYGIKAGSDVTLACWKKKSFIKKCIKYYYSTIMVSPSI